jgi:hypothetical protein
MTTRVTVATIGCLAVLVAVGALGRHQAAAQQPACLHGSEGSESDRGRRMAALDFVRHINNLEAAAAGANGGRYLASDQLQVTRRVPDGFQLRLTASAATYAFSLQDETDPCRFGFFSDERGLIFRGEAIR